MTMSAEDRQRMIGLINEGRVAGDTPEIVVRRIKKRMPHITNADIRELAAVHAEECRMDAAEYQARADGRL